MGMLIVESHDPELGSQIWRAADKTGTIVQSMMPAQNSLEEVFVQTVAEAGDAST